MVILKDYSLHLTHFITNQYRVIQQHMLKTHGIQVFFMSPQRQFISLDFELTYPWFQITLVIQDTYQVKIQR